MESNKESRVLLEKDMANGMETALGFRVCGFGLYRAIDNQTGKNMEDDMETGTVRGKAKEYRIGYWKITWNQLIQD